MQVSWKVDHLELVEPPAAKKWRSAEVPSTPKPWDERDDDQFSELELPIFPISDDEEEAPCSAELLKLSEGNRLLIQNQFFPIKKGCESEEPFPVQTQKRHSALNGTWSLKRIRSLRMLKPVTVSSQLYKVLPMTL